MHNAESEFSKKSFKKNGFQKYVLRQLLFTQNAELGSLFISSNNFSLCHACVRKYVQYPDPKAYCIFTACTVHCCMLHTHSCYKYADGLTEIFFRKTDLSGLLIDILKY